jgi:hypothetical protein
MPEINFEPIDAPVIEEIKEVKKKRGRPKKITTESIKEETPVTDLDTYVKETIELIEQPHVTASETKISDVFKVPEVVLSPLLESGGVTSNDYAPPLNPLEEYEAYLLLKEKRKCPICSKKLTKGNLGKKEHTFEFFISCKNKECDFAYILEKVI